MQLKPSQQTPCCPGILTTDAVLQAPTWLGSVGAQMHPNGNAEQFITVPPVPANVPPPPPPDPGAPLPSLPPAPLPGAKPPLLFFGTSSQPADASNAVTIATRRWPVITVAVGARRLVIPSRCAVPLP